MKKLTQMVLMLCLVLSGAWCYAHGAARTESEKGKDGVPITVIQSVPQSGSEKSHSIIPTLNGHYLTVVFTENLGQVNIEITSILNDYLETDYVLTPNGLLFYIPFTGDYIITFTLPNGDEYYGEFTVTD